MRFFVPYPTLNDYTKEKIKYKHYNYKFSYLNKTQNLYDEIKVDHNDNPIIFKDQNQRWYYGNDNLKIMKRVNFNTKPLFGKDGIASRRSTLGVGIFWKSKKTMRRGVKEIAQFTYADELVDSSAEIVFDDKKIRDELEIEVIIYLVEHVEDMNDQNNLYAKTPGTILGKLDYKKIIFTGSGSLFPTISISDKDAPLWSLSMYTDFDDNIENVLNLIINEAHPKFKLLNVNDKSNYSEALVEEISINIIYQIIINSIDQKELLKDNYPDGTLGSIVRYYINIYNIDLDTKEDIYYKISKGVRP